MTLKSEVVLVLHTDSRESLNKALQFKSASVDRGFTPLLIKPNESIDLVYDALGDQSVAAVIPCSDSLTWMAVEISSDRSLIAHTDPTPFLSKSAGYDLFASVGFSTLKHHEIKTEADVRSSTIDGEIFVKPDWSSGVHSVSPWGYKHFESKDAFAKVIAEDMPLFLSTARNPHARLMMMEYVEHDGVYCISAVMRQGKAACFGHSFMAISGDDHFYDYVLYDDTGNTKALEPLVAKLWDAGFRSNFLYLQCLVRDGVLYPMDVNTRLSTYLDSLATRYDPGFHGRALDFIMGVSDDLRLNLPADSCLIGRVRSDPHKPIKELVWEPQDGIHPLNFDKLTTSCAAYDKAYSWPTYVCLGDSTQDVLEKREYFQTTVKVIQ